MKKSAIGKYSILKCLFRDLPKPVMDSGPATIATRRSVKKPGECLVGDSPGPAIGECSILAHYRADSPDPSSDSGSVTAAAVTRGRAWKTAIGECSIFAH